MSKQALTFALVAALSGVATTHTFAVDCGEQLKEGAGFSKVVTVSYGGRSIPLTHSSPVKAVAVSHHGFAITSTKAADTLVWDLRSGKAVGVVAFHSHYGPGMHQPAAPIAIAFSQTGLYFATAATYHDEIKIWRLAPLIGRNRGEHLGYRHPEAPFRVRHLPGFAETLAFTPDGRGIAVAKRETDYSARAKVVEVIDIPTGKAKVAPFAPRIGRDEKIVSLTFSPNGNDLEVRGSKGTRTRWTDLLSGRARYAGR